MNNWLSAGLFVACLSVALIGCRRFDVMHETVPFQSSEAQCNSALINIVRISVLRYEEDLSSHQKEAFVHECRGWPTKMVVCLARARDHEALQACSGVAPEGSEEMVTGREAHETVRRAARTPDPGNPAPEARSNGIARERVKPPSAEEKPGVRTIRMSDL